jgi:hypothetical protein
MATRPLIYRSLASYGESKTNKSIEENLVYTKFSSIDLFVYTGRTPTRDYPTILPKACEDAETSYSRVVPRGHPLGS